MFLWIKSSLQLFFEKTRSRYLFSPDKLSIVLHTYFAHRVKVLIVVASCDIGLWDDSSSVLSVCFSFP